MNANTSLTRLICRPVALALTALSLLSACAPESEPDAAVSAGSTVERPAIIAHRGASGYLPEHSQAAFTLAYAQGADYLEPDLVMTADGALVVLHDLYLDAVTDVRERFPGRAREDGLNYVVDFTLAELRELRMHERIEPESREQRYPARFPADRGRFQIMTLAELIELTQGLNQTLGRDVGIYPELKYPPHHSDHGHDMAAALMAVLENYGYVGPDANCVIQSFYPAVLKQLRFEMDVEIPLVQLITTGTHDGIDYEAMLAPEGLDQIATYADGIGPYWRLIVTDIDASGSPRFSNLVSEAQDRGLIVHPYTFRADALPDGVDADTKLEWLLKDSGVNGLFTDQPDVMRAFIDDTSSQQSVD